MRNQIQNAFNAGELSPEMWGREDSASYKQGCRTMYNFIVQPLGGATRRPGTRFEYQLAGGTRVFPFSYGDERHHIEIGDEFLRTWEQHHITGVWALQSRSGVQLPQIVAGAAHSHWWEDGVTDNFLSFETTLERFPLRTGMGPYQLTTTATTIPSGLSLATDYWVYVKPGLLTTGIPQPEENNPVHLGFCTDRDKAFELDADGFPDPDTVAVVDVGTGTGVHTLSASATSVPYVFTAPWAAFFLPYLRAKQVDNKMYFYDGFTALHVLERLDFTGGNTQNPSPAWAGPKWILYEVPLLEGPWKARENWVGDPVQWISLNITSPDGDITSHPSDHEAGAMKIPEDYQLSKTSGDSAPLDFIFGQDRDAPADFIVAAATETHDGATPATYIPIHDSLTSPTTPREVKCNNWAMGLAFNNTGPAAVGWYDNRLLLSGGYNPHELNFGSLVRPWVFLPVNHDGSADELTAFTLDIFGDTDDRIVAYSEMFDLLVFTGTGVWIANSRSAAEGIHSTSFAIRQIATVGCSSLIEPVKMQESVAYLSRTNKRLRLIQYSNDAKDYRSFDTLNQHEHILQSGAVDLAYQDEPHDVIWLVREDGSMASVVMQKEDGVIGASRHGLGGTDAVVEYAFTGPSPRNLVIPALSPADDADNLYMVVERTVNSTTKHFVERLDTPAKLGTNYSTANTKSDAYYVDCGMTFEESSSEAYDVTTITMAHLPNETVDILCEGEYKGTVTLNGSGVSPTLPASTHGGGGWAIVHAGYAYTSELEPMPPSYDTQGGTTAGSTMKIRGASLRLHGTIGGGCGDRSDEVTDGDSHEVLSAIDYPNPGELFSGDIAVMPEVDISSQPTIVFRTTKPYPATVNAVIYSLEGTMKGDHEGRTTND